MIINVLLASYKGHKYIYQQLGSILKQRQVDTLLWISDDESAKNLGDFLSKDTDICVAKERVKLLDGPKCGVNHNFLHLIHTAYASSNLDLFCYSDQDDVWNEDKLLTAKLKLAASQESSLYMGRTMVCDEKLTPLYLSKGKNKPASFRNALLESIAGGNTMVFNVATLNLLKLIQCPVHHDWLTYMVVTSCGGNVIFDETPFVLYRQHQMNVIGANRGILAKFYRFKQLLNSEFYGWAENNILALTPVIPHMTEESKQIFMGFQRLHNMQGWYHCVHRLILFKQLGLYRQRFVDHCGFMLAAFLGKI